MVKNVRKLGSVLSFEAAAKEQLNRLIRRAENGCFDFGGVVPKIMRRYANACLTYPTIANGGTAGRLKTTSAVSFRIAGALYTKAATDDLWNLSAETNTAALKYRGYLLLLDTSGTASFVAIATDVASAALAVAGLEALIPADKCVIGAFIAGPETDFDAGGGLAAQGTIHQGLPSGLTLIAHTSLIANGSTAGKLRLGRAIGYLNAGKPYVSMPLDDAWDLSAKADTTSSQYRAFLLCVDAGTFSVVDGRNRASAAAAVADIQKQIPEGKAVVGLFVASPSCNFDHGGGLAAQGTIYEGFPEAATIEEITFVQ